MPAYAVIGAQWGDEGKGKIIDFLAENAAIIARYSGGNNAGHTVINDAGTYKLHLVPSGICWPHIMNVIGNGVVVDPDVLLTEINENNLDPIHDYKNSDFRVVVDDFVENFEKSKKKKTIKKTESKLELFMSAV